MCVCVGWERTRKQRTLAVILEHQLALVSIVLVLSTTAILSSLSCSIPINQVSMGLGVKCKPKQTTTAPLFFGIGETACGLPA